MSQHPDDDLFKETRMTFGEHIEELRGALVKALFWLVLFSIVGLYFGGKVVEFIQTPLTRSLSSYYEKKALDELDDAPEYELEVRNTIHAKHLVPDHIQVDPMGILEALKAAAPEHFQDLEIKRFQFTTDDIALDDLKAFATLLHKGKDAAKAEPEQVIWKEMESADQALTAEIANKTKPVQQDLIAFVALLNRLTESKTLHGSKALQETVSSDDSTAVENLRKSLEKHPDKETNRRVNRLLLSSTFPNHLREPQVLLIPVPAWKSVKVQVQALSAHEAFMIWVKAGFILGFILASPFIFRQIWHFVAAGLYPHEKRYVHIYLPFSLILFLSGAAMAFFFVFDPVLDFLFSFNRAMNIDPDPRISEWISFVLFLPLGFGVAFQLPLVMLFLNRLTIISVETYLAKWRIAILVIFVASMLLTPADPISMLLMAAPLTVLYFLGIAMCQWMPRGRNPFDEAYEP